MTQKQQLINDIKEMQEVFNDADTPQNTKDSIKPSLTKAKDLLKQLEAAEKPAPKPVEKTVKQTTPNTKHQTPKQQTNPNPKPKTVAKKAVVKSKTATKKLVSDIDALLAKIKANPKLKEHYKGTSKSSIENDAKRQALKPGKRTSASGEVYYENRADRTDIGKFLADGGGIGSMAKILVISSKNPLSKQLNAETGDSWNDIDFEEKRIGNYGSAIKHKKSGKTFVVFTDNYISQVDNDVIEDDLDYVTNNKIFGIDAFDFSNMAGQFAKGGRLELGKIGKLKDSMPTADKKEMIEIYEYEDKYIIAGRRDGWEANFIEKLYPTYEAAYKAAGIKANSFADGGGIGSKNLLLVFKYTADYKKAIHWFEEKSAFSFNKQNDEFKTLYFSINDQDDANNLEKFITEELNSETDIDSFYFEGEGNLEYATGGGIPKPMRYGKEFHKYKIGDNVIVDGYGKGIITAYETSRIDNDEIPSYWVLFDKSVYQDGPPRNIWERNIKNSFATGGLLTNGKSRYEKGDEGMYEGDLVRILKFDGTHYHIAVLDEDENISLFDPIKSVFRDKFEPAFAYFQRVKDDGTVAYASGGNLSKNQFVEKTIVYDNGGKSLDRYTVFTPDGSVYGMSENASGFNQYIGEKYEIQKGSHLGKKLSSVPKEIEWAVIDRMETYANGGNINKPNFNYNQLFEKFKREDCYISQPVKSNSKDVFVEMNAHNKDVADAIKSYLQEKKIDYTQGSLFTVNSKGERYQATFHLKYKNASNKMAGGGNINKTFYKEGSNRYGLEKTEIFIHDKEEDSFDVYDNIYHETNGNHNITKLATFNTMDEAKEFAINHSKTKYKDGGNINKGVSEYAVTITDEDGNSYDSILFAKNEDEALYKAEQEHGINSVETSVVQITDKKGNKIQYKDGGNIPNNYQGKSPAEVWDSWSVAQREHFISDHSHKVENKTETWRYVMAEVPNRTFDNIPYNIKKVVEEHVKTGQYKEGGVVSNADKEMFFNYCKEFYGRNGIYPIPTHERNFDSNGASDEKIKKAIDKYLNDKDLSKKWGGGDSLDREIVRDIMLYGLDAVKQNGVSFERGGSLTKRRFTIYDFRTLTNDGFAADLNNDGWHITEENSNKVLGIFNEDNETIKAVGSKKIDNPLVKWLQQNSFTSSDEYWKLENGSIIPSHFGSGKNIKVFNYQTQHFDNCTPAATAFATAQEHIENEYKDTDAKTFILYSNALENCAKKIDEILGIEKQIVLNAVPDACHNVVELLQECGVFNYKSGMQLSFNEVANFLMPHIATIQEFAALEEKIMYEGGGTKIVARGNAVMAINAETNEVLRKIFLLHEDDSVENTAWFLAYQYNLVDHPIKPLNPQLELDLQDKKPTADLYKIGYKQLDENKILETEVRHKEVFSSSEDNAEQQFIQLMLPKENNEDYVIEFIEKIFADGGGIQLLAEDCISIPFDTQEFDNLINDKKADFYAVKKEGSHGFWEIRDSGSNAIAKYDEVNEMLFFDENNKTFTIWLAANGYSFASGGGILREIYDRYGSSYRGNGMTYFDRQQQYNDDYKSVAHISEEGVVKYYQQDLPTELKNKIEAEAAEIKEKGFGHNVFATGGKVDNKFNYMMLDRLRSDCEYYLNYGNRSENVLARGSVDAQISEMKRIWNSLPQDGKPNWLSMEDILDYERQMKDGSKMADGGKLRQPKYEVGDVVSYEGGDLYIEKWVGVITKVVDLDTEYAYRIDAYTTNLQSPMQSLSKYNEKYEVQLKRSPVSKFEAAKKDYDERTFAKGGNIEKIVFTKAEDAKYDELMSFYLNDGLSERKAEKETLAEMIVLFPRLKKPLENGAKIEASATIMATGGKVGGRGWEGATKGARINDIKEFEVGKVYLSYSPQFNAKNLIKITSLDKTGLKRPIVYAEYVRNTGNDHEFAIWDFDLKNNEYYKAKEESYLAKGGGINLSLIKKYSKENPYQHLPTLASNIVMEHLNKGENLDGFKNVDWNNLSKEDHDKMTKKYDVEKRNLENHLINEYLKAYFSNEDIRKMCKGDSERASNSSKRIMRNQLATYKNSNKTATTFKQKQTAIAKALEGKKVPRKYQKTAGKKYNHKEAMAAAAKIEGSILAKSKKK